MSFLLWYIQCIKRINEISIKTWCRYKCFEKNGPTPYVFLHKMVIKKLIEILVENGFDLEKHIIHIMIIHKPDEKTNQNVLDGYGDTIFLILCSSGSLAYLKYVVKICKEKNIDLNLYCRSSVGTKTIWEHVKVDIIQLTAKYLMGDLEFFNSTNKIFHY